MQRPIGTISGLDFAFGVDEPEGFCPFDGGTRELPGVFGGRPSLASSSATRAASRDSRVTSVMSASFSVRMRRRPRFCFSRGRTAAFTMRLAEIRRSGGLLFAGFGGLAQA